jgi:hypothetical protein
MVNLGIVAAANSTDTVTVKSIMNEKIGIRTSAAG